MDKRRGGYKIGDRFHSFGKNHCNDASPLHMWEMTEEYVEEFHWAERQDGTLISTPASALAQRPSA
jgi:hypothetical protein|eukprot:CAMPEP_0174320738 /NCGR_PEP_ID=MMETSP0810-20121108/9772_1 /TAXON_ID=73025 ORGANISM="Eutreptiella gymnastica-like, Strain CCMP1594" /NCGR_SAMPLE_ID=MMETSP0810 /ASSEMBLY_ACC=CAM_ASM_000659 /LENGTH=65 /DNA_ID=CAMNT_0015431795 /DNA_START=1318 /DNA_END=1515 /DNA_ORIENTATION=-